MKYILAIQAPVYRISSLKFAAESALVHHLKALRDQLINEIPEFSGISLFCSHMDVETYDAGRHHMEELDADDDLIEIRETYPASISMMKFYIRYMYNIYSGMKYDMRSCAIAHADLATDVRRPMTFLLAVSAWRSRCPVLLVTDIDYRKHAERNRNLRRWGRGKYFFNKIFQNKFKDWQIKLAVERSQLVLLKSASLVADMGKGRGHVKNFFDSVHSLHDVIDEDELERRAEWFCQIDDPLELCYFGRMVEYKGIDRMIDAMSLLKDRGSHVRLTLIGDGEMRSTYEARVREFGLGDRVTFISQVPYGQPLFDLLSRMHVALATPLLEDTPRAAFDAMARGLPMIAFDISYFRDLAKQSDAIALAAWPSAHALADVIVAVDADRPQLARMARNAVEFARLNTQQIWLERRIKWTQEFLLGRSDKAQGGASGAGVEVREGAGRSS